MAMLGNGPLGAIRHAAVVLLATGVVTASSVQAQAPPSPIKVLLMEPGTDRWPLGGDTNPDARQGWVAALTNPTCTGGGMVEGLDFEIDAYPPEYLRDWATRPWLEYYDIIAFPSLLDVDVVPNNLLCNKELDALLRDAPRVFVTGLHMDAIRDHVNPTDPRRMASFSQVMQQAITWLHADGSALPSVIALPDGRSASGWAPYSYLPWSGLRTSGPAAGSQRDLEYDDVTLVARPEWSGFHPVFASTTDGYGAPCFPNDARTSCTLDDAFNSLHTVWQSGIPGGFEDDGFVVNLLGQLGNPECPEGLPEAPNPPFAGDVAGLVLDPSTIPAARRTFIPFFREDGSGLGHPGTALTLVNANQDAALVRVIFRRPNGSAIATVQGTDYYQLVVPGNGTGNVAALTSPILLSLVLPSIAALNLNQIGSIEIQALGRATDMARLDQPVHGRAYVLADGDNINTAEGFILSSQSETALTLRQDFFFDVRAGGGPNFLTREWVVLQNTQSEEATFKISFYGAAGGPMPIAEVNGVVQPYGCYTYNTAALAGPGTFMTGSSVVQVTPNSAGRVMRLVGASVSFGPGQGPNDVDPAEPPVEGEPRLGTDLRPPGRM